MMSKTKVAVTLNTELLGELDELIARPIPEPQSGNRDGGRGKTCSPGAHATGSRGCQTRSTRREGARRGGHIRTLVTEYVGRRLSRATEEELSELRGSSPSTVARRGATPSSRPDPRST